MVVAPNNKNMPFLNPSHACPILSIIFTYLNSETTSTAGSLSPDIESPPKEVYVLTYTSLIYL